MAKIVAPNAGGAGLIPGPGTRPQRPQLRILMLQRRLKISHAATKNWHSQINKINIYINKQILTKNLSLKVDELKYFLKDVQLV